ncbi:hypothetical protein WICPIJ_006397 [Wickerhamomyces pijperi]|uniref:IMP-specific 5'-nucleotidase 1 n=1 Tax=Wickerhamomyces pijperi TaxID=599730 RepID=A0A9P8TK91_WICPI|nr:hypothetical protein WICPIJ_006397 [Wickerhamomyces pijperi]
MASRYRVESHRRDEFIEWIKGLLAVPFVLHSGVQEDARARYTEVLIDVEGLVEHQIEMTKQGTPKLGRLSQLVPSISNFFTKLPLKEAFVIQDERRSISGRRLVSPSFNDIRLILNTAQALAFTTGETSLKLVTFDGDVTLYEDGCSLTDPSAEIVQCLIDLLSKNIIVGVVTAAGYNDHNGVKYYERLMALIDTIRSTDKLTGEQKENFTVMGGESNYLFRYSNEEQNLKWIEPQEWLLDSMSHWKSQEIEQVLDLAEETLNELKAHLQLPAQIIRKHRAVGLVPVDGKKLCREQLEEVVLYTKRRLESFPPTKTIKFCAFDGGSDVWIDIASKDLGVSSLQRYFGGIKPQETLHVGDQFVSVGSNDFKTRLSGCTAWIANPEETVLLLQDLIRYMEK